MSPPKLCTAAVIVLFLGCCLSLNLFLSLNLSHKSALCVGISLSSSAIDASLKKYFYSMLPRLQLVPRAISAPPTVPRHNIGDYSRWAFIDKDRAFTLGVYLRRAFNHGMCYLPPPGNGSTDILAGQSGPSISSAP